MADRRYQARVTSARRYANAQRALEATAAQEHLFRCVWAQLDTSGQVVDSEVTLRTLAAAVPTSAHTLFSRLYRLKVPHRKDARRHGEVWLTQSAARQLVTYHPGNRRGRVNNPKKRNIPS